MWRLRVVHSTGYAYKSAVTASFNEARLTPCRRSRSGTGTPASASFRIQTIWLSVSFDLRMTTLEPRAVEYRPLSYRGSLRCEGTQERRLVIRRTDMEIHFEGS